jgi:hypothetical protein
VVKGDVADRLLEIAGQINLFLLIESLFVEDTDNLVKLGREYGEVTGAFAS